MASKVAYTVYNYNVDPATGQVGRADFNGSAITHNVNNITAGVNTGITADSKVFWFPNANNQGRLLLAETQYSSAGGQASPSKISIYDADNWGTQVYPVDPNNNNAPTDPTTWGDAVNIYAVARDGNLGKLYFIDYDNHKVYSVSNTNGDIYELDSNSYVYDGDGSTQVFGVDLAVIGNGQTAGAYDSSVYALFIRGANVYGGNYDPSTLVKLPRTLGSTPTAINNSLAKNAYCIKPYAGDLYIAAIGGAQNYDTWNADSRIQKANQSDLTVISLLRSAATGTAGGPDTTDFRDIAFKITTNGEVFILKGIFDQGGSSFNGFLFRTTMGVLATANPDPVANPDGVLISSLSEFTTSISISGTGYFWALLYSPDDDATWMEQGNELAVYKYVPAQGGNPATINLIASLGMGSGAGFLAPTGNDLYVVTIFGQTVQLKGAKNPSKVSVNAPTEEEEK
jgi:hypothetical protein